MRQYAIIGLGRFGTSLAKALAEMGHQVLVVDHSAEKVQEIAPFVTQAVQLDSVEEGALRQVGIRNFDVVVVAIGEDLQANILTTLILKEMGVKCIIAKAVNELHGKVLERIGADRVVYPERDMALRLARHLGAVNVLDVIQLSPEYNIEEIRVPKKFAGRTLGQLDLRARSGLNVISIRRGEEVLIAPGADDVLKEGDVIAVVGKKKFLERLEEK